MPELIDLEGIVVDNPGAVQIAADRVRRHLVTGGIGQQPPSDIHGGVQRRDLDYRKNVAFVAAIILRRLGPHGRACRTCGGEPARQHGAKRPDV